MKEVVIIAIGNPLRRDDGLGPAAAAALATRLPDAEIVLLDGEPTRLVDAWAGRRLAVVLDSIRGGDPPGTIHRIEVGSEPFPDAERRHTTHGGGLAAALALGRALDRCPDRLVICGIEPADMTQGRGLSPAVEAGLPGLLDRVAAEVWSSCA